LIVRNIFYKFNLNSKKKFNIFSRDFRKVE
jgi:hypothetical protein